MRQLSPRRLATLLALGALAACADSIPSEPSAVATAAKMRSIESDELSSTSYVLEAINAQLEAEGADHRVLKAEFLLDGTQWDGVTSTIIIANDRFKGIGTEWVPNDPRRGGRLGVTYANAIGDATQDDRPLTRDPNGANLRFVPYDQLHTQLNEGVVAWANQSCTRRPVQLVVPAANTNPDNFDDLILGFPFDPDGAGPLPAQPAARALPTVPYVQAADIVQAGWLSRTFFDRLSPPNGSAGIIGVTLTSAFIVPGSSPAQLSDIDGNGLADTRRAEIYYNTRFAWGTTQAGNVVDFYSVIAHETGHAYGLNHFGKVFATKKDGAGGITVAEIRYAPYAMMNAVYITGRNELAPTDISSYCNIFGRQQK